MCNPRIKLMRTVWTVKEKIENSSSCALVLHMTSNLIISRRSQDENGKEMYQKVYSSISYGIQGGLRDYGKILSCTKLQ